jgi:choline-sulfatase
MDAVARLPRFADNTLVVYFSDHGDYVGSHGLDTTKVQHHEESVRIPAVFHCPSLIDGQGQRNELFSLVDLFATTLDLIGADVPPYSQGTSFAPALRGEPFGGPDAVLLEMVNNPRWNLRFLDWRGVVTSRWKYAYCETRREELFDLENDPYELRNLAQDLPERCEEMRRLLLRLLDETREPYFHVIIEHGVAPEGPVTDVGNKADHLNGVLRKGGVSPRDRATS